ncbi:hypothetical protein DPMN_144989 [Dreissena polymorpha]|uniref:Uncharacterized protein n=1 Tax=Dreissena polymorpha TaxID=45954 RepID=A0A9D4F486_DREPO|nr:hypothetical protein DPMN_144989 [Dreissena polymorpha]
MSSCERQYSPHQSISIYELIHHMSKEEARRLRMWLGGYGGGRSVTEDADLLHN